MSAAKKGYRAVGIDPSLGAVMAARRVARQLGLEIKCIVGDARFLPFGLPHSSACFLTACCSTSAEKTLLGQ